jgi:hypothetical protein
MFRDVCRNWMLALTIVAMMASANRALASTVGTAPTPTAAQGADPNGVTGTDPEPIEPGLVEMIVTLLSFT